MCVCVCEPASERERERGDGREGGREEERTGGNQVGGRKAVDGQEAAEEGVRRAGETHLMVLTIKTMDNQDHGRHKQKQQENEKTARR
jgi:hypothetical protein